MFHRYKKLQAATSPNMSRLVKQTKQVKDFASNCSSHAYPTDKIIQDVYAIYTETRKEAHDDITSLDFVLSLFPHIDITADYRSLLCQTVAPWIETKGYTIGELEQLESDITANQDPKNILLCRYILNWLMMKLNRTLLTFESGKPLKTLFLEAGPLKQDYPPSDVTFFKSEIRYTYVINKQKTTVTAKM